MCDGRRRGLRPDNLYQSRLLEGNEDIHCCGLVVGCSHRHEIGLNLGFSPERARFHFST